VVLWNQISISNGYDIFNGECDAMVNMTLNDLLTKIKVFHFGTNPFFIYDFL